MQQQWQLIKEWNDLSSDKKLTATLAIVILALVGVVLYYESKYNRQEIDFKKELKEANEKHLKYVTESEKEFKGLYFELQKLKSK